MTRLNPASRLVAVGVAALMVLTASACSNGDGSGGDDAAGTTSAPAPDARAAEPYDGYGNHRSEQYDGTTNWICHPDRSSDECHDIDTTVLAADGGERVRPTKPAADPPIDCFYVYPTASSDPGPSADLDVDASEIDTVRAQVARYSTACRVFAPAYRQVTLVGIGTADAAAREQAYADVLDAWKTYVAQLNEGRGVVLIGHSQGAGLLKRLMVDEIDADADLRRLLVSAVLMGTTVSVPEGEDVGGDFQEIPACRQADDIGCVIAFVSYPADRPPTAGAIFGGSGEEGEQALCVDPVELAGGDGRADTVLLAKPTLIGSAGGTPGADTPFASLPGALRARCTVSGPYSFLAFSPAEADGADERDVDRLLMETLGPAWGLHLVDANLAQDDLIDVVRQQAEAFAR